MRCCPRVATVNGTGREDAVFSRDASIVIVMSTQFVVVSTRQLPLPRCTATTATPGSSLPLPHKRRTRPPGSENSAKK